MYHRLWILTAGALQVLSVRALPAERVRNGTCLIRVKPFADIDNLGFFTTHIPRLPFLRKRIRPTIINPLQDGRNSSRANVGGEKSAQTLYKNTFSIPYANTALPESPDAAIKYNSEPTGHGNSTRDTAKGLQVDAADAHQNMRIVQVIPNPSPVTRPQPGSPAPLNSTHTTKSPAGGHPPGKSATLARPNPKGFGATGAYRKNKWDIPNIGPDGRYNAASRAAAAHRRPGGTVGGRSGTAPSAAAAAAPDGGGPRLDDTRFFSTPAEGGGGPGAGSGGPPAAAAAATVKPPDGLVLVVDGSVDVIRNNGTHLNLTAKAGPTAGGGAADRPVGRGGAAPDGPAGGGNPNAGGDLGWGNQGCGAQGCGCGNQGAHQCGCQCGCNQCPCGRGCGCN